MKQLFLFISIIILTTSLVAQDNSSNLSYAELDSLYSLEYQNGHYDVALSYAKQATTAAYKLENSDSVYARSLFRLGNMHRELSNNAPAENVFLEALSIQQKALGKTHSDCAKTSTSLALIYIDEGKFDLAESYSLDALDIHKKNVGKESVGYAVALNNLALLYYNIDQNEAAEIAYLEVLSIFKILVGDKHSAYAQVSKNLASSYINMQKYTEAEALLNQVLTNYKESLGTEHPKYIEAMAALALLYDYMKQYDQSEDLYLKILTSREKKFGKNHTEYIESLTNLAGLYAEMGKYIESKPLQETVVSFFKNKYGENHPNYLTSLNNLGLLYIELEDYGAAEKTFSNLLEIKKNSINNLYYNASMDLNNYALLYRKTKNFDKALFYYTEALTVNNKDTVATDLNNLSPLLSDDFTTNSNALMSLHGLAKTYDDLYKKTGDLQYLEKRQNVLDIAIQFNDKTRATFERDQDKLRALSKTSELVESILENTVELLNVKKDATAYVEAAFSHAEQNKSILLMDAIKGQQAINFGDLPDSLKAKELLLQNAVADLKKEKAASTTKDKALLLQKKEMELTLDVNNFKQLLKDKYPQYNALKYNNTTASSNDIQQLLKEDEALIEYFVADKTLYAFYVDKKTIKLYDLDVSLSILHSKVSLLRNGLTNYLSIREDGQKAFEAYTKPAFWFYSKIVAPVLIDAKDIKHLIVIADGELGHLPFEVFLTEQASQTKSDYNNLKYLLHDFNISYNYSATLLKTNSELSPRQHNGKLLAIAPRYDGDSTASDVRRPMHLEKLRKVLSPLPEAIKEIKGLEDLLAGSFWYGDEGNEAKFKEKAGDYAVIHLAMHGLSNNYTPILSSLAFTENGDSKEDNFLHAHEISKLKLNADLVVLSACETGYGKFEQGEGILSLARSFMYAGTPSLVVSLWPVNDGSTAVIMKLFYEKLADGMTKSEALQQAKSIYLKNTSGIIAHPAFWSPFIIIGKTEPILLKKKDNPLIWGIGSGILALLGVGGFVMMKKK